MPGPDARAAALAAALSAGAALYVAGGGDNPPGFHVDESAIAYNALSVAESGRDEHGAAWPTFFESYGDYKSAPFVYLLAAVLKVTGPDVVAARALSALLAFAAVALIALVAARAGGGAVAGAAIGVSAALTPWLFETGRLAFEAVLVPGLVAAALLLARADPWRRRESVALGLVLALLTYAYQSGRLLGPALAVGLALFGWRRVRLAWLVYALALVPLAVFALRHPGALSARFETSSYVDDGGSAWSILRTFGEHYAASFSPSGLLLDGDPNARHHVQWLGAMLIGTVALAVAGTVLVLRRRRDDPWWRYVLLGLLVAPVPGALTVDRFHALRLAAVPVFLLVLAAPAVEWLWRTRERRWLLAAALAATAIQGIAFQVRFHDEGDERVALFDAEYPAVMAAATRASGGAYHSLHGTHAHCLWYSALEDGDRGRCRRVPEAGLPAGSVAASQHVLDCRTCREVEVVGSFGIYRVGERLRLP